MIHIEFKDRSDVYRIDSSTSDVQLGDRFIIKLVSIVLGYRYENGPSEQCVISVSTLPQHSLTDPFYRSTTPTEG